MKRLIKNITVISLVVGFSGCVQNKTVLNTPNIKTNIDTKSIKNEPIKEIPIPYVKESKFIKILVLPFENSENDIDYDKVTSQLNILRKKSLSFLLDSLKNDRE